jgi:hypothetical protein
MRDVVSRFCGGGECGTIFLCRGRKYPLCIEILVTKCYYFSKENFRVYLGRFENMMAKLLARSIRAVCVGGIALGMTTAMAQDASVVMQHVGTVDGERLVVVAYSDPEGEVGNGTSPPNRESNSEIEVKDALDVPMEVDNFPEGEIGNGTYPPNVNPMAQDVSDAAEIVIVYNDPEGEISNGSDPPAPNFIDPETDVASETERSIEIYNFPESEVGNGIDPPL